MNRTIHVQLDRDEDGAPTVCSCGSDHAIGPGSAETCEICERTAANARGHPCRFAKGCSCWRGIPCQGERKKVPRCGIGCPAGECNCEDLS